ncbi:hypothetical protein Agabi119p4_4303 [Agaricus bisporus var. burnettii]|uniref:PX domain-containing protein n=1 Tax=Agaricus bisporus var. burnettii TaxID=192524 RepID=A0A8H7F2W4_AGABI|nr:hypothetical protein Agabi119p4_4303 [Agaricus bisporus var. burnettii]
MAAPTLHHPSTDQQPSPVLQPAPHYATYKPRPRARNPPRPTRSVPPIPNQSDTPASLDRSHSAFVGPAIEPPSSVPLEETAREQDNQEDSQAPKIPAKSISTNPIESLQATHPEELTALRAHYLKKSLIQLQFERELEALISVNPRWPNVSTLSYLGSPFQPPPKDAPDVDMPFLKYIFRQFVSTFPFMASAPKNFYSQKLQPFATSVISRNLSATSVLDDDEAESRGDQASQKKLLMKVQKNLSLFLGSATRLVEREEVVRLTQVDLDRLETLTKRRQARMKKDRDTFEINIVSVRTVVDKGRVRSRAHDEFIIRTRQSHYEDVYVARRYGDFRTLATELTKAHPEEIVRAPPAKDRTYVTVNSPTIPTPQPSFTSSLYGSDSPPTTPTTPADIPSRLAREKNRLTLRSYLRTLMSSSVILTSPVFKSFLLSSPISLTAEEEEDAKKREEADRVREDGRQKFAKEIANRVDALRDAVKSVKGDIMGKDGLQKIFGTIKETPNVRDLPPNYQAVVEWARISLASTVFHQFVASDNASESFAGLKRIHGLMPYFMLKTAMKISNPIGMIRSILDLFMAQPFGGKSLIQRMFTSSLAEEAKQLQEEIESIKDKIDDPMICAKIRHFVYAPREIQEMFKADSVSEKMNIFVVILRSAEQPVLMRPQMQRLARAHKAHLEYERYRSSLEDSDDDDGPQNEDAWLMEDLKVLAFLYTRLRDRELLIDLIYEGFTAELLKDMITIFYTPLAQVYRAASIADSLGDMQSFINDLIKTVEQVEEMMQEDPQHTVQAFIDLMQRHEQSFYYFVHKVHSKGEGLFNSLMQWIEMFLTVMREGLGDPLSLEYLLPHSGKERGDILAEVDKVALYHYKRKMIHEDKLRRRFGNAEGHRDAEAEEEATQVLVSGVLGELDFGNFADQDSDSEELDEDTDDGYSSSDYTTSEDTSSGSFHTDESSGSSDVSSSSASVSGHPLDYPTSSVPAMTPSATPSISTSPIPPQLTHRSTSSTIRGIKSMTSLGNLKRSLRDVPPVPALPQTQQTALSVPTSSAKSLPSTPNPGHGTRAVPSIFGRRSDGQQLSKPSEVSPNSHRKYMLKRGSKKVNLLEPPELVQIPQLLPIFVELMRPALRIRPINQNNS